MADGDDFDRIGSHVGARMPDVADMGGLSEGHATPGERSQQAMDDAPVDEVDLIATYLDTGCALDTLSVLPQRSLAEFLR